MTAFAAGRVLCGNVAGGMLFVAALTAGGVSVDIVIVAPIGPILALPPGEQPVRLHQVVPQSHKLCIASIDGRLCIVFMFGAVSARTAIGHARTVKATGTAGFRVVVILAVEDVPGVPRAGMGIARGVVVVICTGRKMLTVGVSRDFDIGMAAVVDPIIAVAVSTPRCRQLVTTVALRRRIARGNVIASWQVPARLQGCFRELSGWCGGLFFQPPPSCLCGSFFAARLPFGCARNYLDELVSVATVRADDDKTLAAGRHVRCGINIHDIRVCVDFDE